MGLVLQHLGMLRPQVLQNQSAHTGDVGGGHGGAAHHVIAAAVHGGVDVAAGGGHIGHQAQVGGDAPGGEVTHLTGGGVVHDGGLFKGHDGQGAHTGLAVRGGGQRLTGGLGDKDVGQLVGVLHVHAEILVHIVIDDDGRGTCVIGVNLLVHEGQVAALNDRDLSCHIQTLVVLSRAVVGDHDILIIRALALTQEAEGQLDGVRIVQGGVGIGKVLPGGGDGEVLGHELAVLHTGHHGSAHSGSGEAHDAVVRVAGQVGVGAPGVLEGGGIGVAGGDDHDHVGLHDLVEQLILLGEAAAGAQGQVHHIHIQTEGILDGGEEVDGAGTAAHEHLHGDDLGVGGHTHHIAALHRVGGGGTGHMGAVGVGHIPVMGHIRVVVAIAVAEGDLPTDVQILGGQLHPVLLQIPLVGVQGGQDALDLLHGQGVLGQGRSLHKGGVIGVQAGVQNGDTHTLTGNAQLFPDLGAAEQVLGLVHVGAHGDIAHVLGHAEHGGHKGLLHAVQGVDLGQGAIGHGDGHAAEHHIIMELGGDLHAALQAVGGGIAVDHSVDAGEQVLLLLEELAVHIGHAALHGGDLGGGVATVQQGLVLHDHDHIHQLIGSIGLILHLLRLLAIVAEIHAGVFDLLDGNTLAAGAGSVPTEAVQAAGDARAGPVGVVSGHGGKSRGGQHADDHDQSDQERKNFIQLFHLFPPPAYKSA